MHIMHIEFLACSLVVGEVCMMRWGLFINCVQYNSCGSLSHACTVGSTAHALWQYTLSITITIEPELFSPSGSLYPPGIRGTCTYLTGLATQPSQTSPNLVVVNQPIYYLIVYCALHNNTSRTQVFT